MKKISLTLTLWLFFSFSFCYSQTRLETESKNFKIIYWSSHKQLVPGILSSAEESLSTLSSLFNYKPLEKITITLNDYHDFGAAGTTSVPHNVIRLDIASFELDYESIPYNDRLRWLISHELVHVVIGDSYFPFSKFLRTLTAKVPPEKEYPTSLFYSLLTNWGRYTPDWHQEGIAMFLETWMNGGYGRLQGSFDEMFFRSMVVENQKLPNPVKLDSYTVYTSFLLQMQFYLYGARFSAYLANKYDSNLYIKWYKGQQNGYKSYNKAFKNIFGSSLKDAWKDFVKTEYYFQKENLARLDKSEYTPITYLSNAPLGWVTQPMINSKKTKIIFGTHAANELAGIKSIDLKTGELEYIGTLPTPRLVQVASTTIDPDAGLLFYTTNNNFLFRDLWLLDPYSKINKKLFKDIRIGDLTYCKKTKELWGIHRSDGCEKIVYTSFPYLGFNQSQQLDFGYSVQQLCASPNGRWLAGTIHYQNGQQEIIVIDMNQVRKNGEIIYNKIATSGSPEHPSWSDDEKHLYWNAYNNGVSNIYRYDFETKKVFAISHTKRGLFRPVPVNGDSVFAFEFTTQGFIPVTIPNKEVEYLPAIKYYGQQIIEKEPQLQQLQLTGSLPETNSHTREKSYNGFLNIKRNSLFPTISGFKNDLVYGFYGYFSDPLAVHEIRFFAGMSDTRQKTIKDHVHFNLKYEYKKTWELVYKYNPANFYDVFNKRKKATFMQNFSAKNTHYWKYDMPHKISHENEISVFYGVKTINDNMITVEHPNFIIYESTINSKNTRRSIGSVDIEQGTEFSLALTSMHIDPKNMKNAGGFHVEWNKYNIFLKPHNVFHLQLAGGWRHTGKTGALTNFYFGGFGNQYIDPELAEQYRKVFRFPGVPIYDLTNDEFIKVGFENKLPPCRFTNFHLGPHTFTSMDLTIFNQYLFFSPEMFDRWANIGTQLNIKLKHWYNIESTLSFGIAQAWNKGGDSWAWFISFKPFR